MKHLLVLFLAWPLFAFSQRIGRYDNDLRVNGTGIVESYGQALMGYTYGISDTGYANKLTVITEYKNFKRHGLKIQFFNYPEDTASVEQYVNDTLAGAFFYNRPNGKVWVRGIYVRGLYAAPPLYYTETGQLIRESITMNAATKLYYLDDTLCNGKISLYNRGGLGAMKVHSDIWFTKGKIDSVYSYRWAYWGVSAEAHLNYIDSCRVYWEYGPGGKPMTFASSRIDTIKSFLQKDGPDLLFVDIDRMTLEGKYIEYHLTSGAIRSEGYFRQGKQWGDWKFYDESGVLIKTVTY